MTVTSRSVASYRDVHLAFEEAGRLGQLLLEFETKQAATAWVARANSYRVLLRKQNEAAGRDHTSPFDHLLVRRQPKDCVVVIEPRGFNFKAVAPDGTEIVLDRTNTVADSRTPHELTEAEKQADDFLRDFEEGKLK